MIAKKITLYSAICDSRFVQIFRFVILGRGPQGGFGPREKNSFNIRAEGLGPRVGSGYEKTRLEPDPLPFLV